MCSHLIHSTVIFLVLNTPFHSLASCGKTLTGHSEASEGLAPEALSAFVTSLSGSPKMLPQGTRKYQANTHWEAAFEGWHACLGKVGTGIGHGTAKSFETHTYYHQIAPQRMHIMVQTSRTSRHDSCSYNVDRRSIVLQILMHILGKALMTVLTPQHKKT